MCFATKYRLYLLTNRATDWDEKTKVKRQQKQETSSPKGGVKYLENDIH